MSDKVVSLSGEPVYTGKPSAAVIELLEEWLEKARSGEIVGVALAAQYRDEAKGQGWAGSVSSGIIGECFALAYRITKHLDEGG